MLALRSTLRSQHPCNVLLGCASAAAARSLLPALGPSLVSCNNNNGSSSGSGVGPFSALQQRRWATKKTAGGSKNGRKSAGRRLGVKIGGGAMAKSNDIILHQRGLKFRPGENVHIGRDHTIHASVDGRVRFHVDLKTEKKYVSVIKLENIPRADGERPLLLRNLTEVERYVTPAREKFEAAIEKRIADGLLHQQAIRASRNASLAKSAENSE